jgi:hypothetical protein
MLHDKFFHAATFAIMIITSILLASCSPQTAQKTAYDPSKNYAAFLVLENPNSAGVLKSIKSRSTDSGYELGPVEYYRPGTNDFEPVLKKLTPSKQITLLWVAGNIMDTPNIQKGLAKVQYKGEVRYMPVGGTATGQSQ